MHFSSFKHLTVVDIVSPNLENTSAGDMISYITSYFMADESTTVDQFGSLPVLGVSIYGKIVVNSYI